VDMYPRSRRGKAADSDERPEGGTPGHPFFADRPRESGRPGRRPSAFAGVSFGVRLLGASVVAGALVAGLGVPLIAGLGLGAKSAVDNFNAMPDTLVVPKLSQSSTIYDADGGVIAKLFVEDRTTVPIGKIAPIMQNALIDIEDHRFYQHGAIDPEGTLRALVTDSSSGGVAQGGSTLTQQLVKNVFAYQAGPSNAAGFAEATAKTTNRKLQELRDAITLEKTTSKQQILDDYLNITYFGEGAYGIEAAAELYFSVHASQLTLPQAALLAGMEQSPSAYDPILNPAAATVRRTSVLNDMATYGTITKAQAAKAEATPIKLNVTVPRTGCITAQQDEEGFFCNYVENVIEQDPAFGKTSTQRVALLDQGGLKIYTTLDPKDQAADVKAIQDHVYSSDTAAAASTMVQPGTGKILAMAQSRPYGTGKNDTEINYNANELYGGALGFQTGSVFKAITAATALSQGIPLSHTINSVVRGDYPAMTNCTGMLLAQPGMENDSDTDYGNINMVKAMADSVNTYFVPLEKQVGLCNVVHMAQAFGLGVQGGLDKAGTALLPISQTQDLTLGVNSLTPLQIANAYAAFAADGKYCDPTAITRVVGSNGKSLPVPSSNCRQVVSQSVAAGVNTLLKSVVSDEGTGSNDSIRWPDAGKTGTTNSEAQAWFAGYTAQISDATMMTDPSNPSVSLNGLDMAGISHDPAYGDETSGPIWQQAMNGAMSGFPEISLASQPAPANPAPHTPPSGPTNPSPPSPPTRGHHPHR